MFVRGLPPRDQIARPISEPAAWRVAPLAVAHSRLRIPHHRRHRGALVAGDRRWEARGGERGMMYDIALWIVPFGLIGGRLYHLATDWQTYLGPGGAGIRAACGSGTAGWASGVRWPSVPWRVDRLSPARDPRPAFADAIAPGIMWRRHRPARNYFNQELYGRETTLPWGLEISIVGIPRDTWTRIRSTASRRASRIRRGADIPLRIAVERPDFRCLDLRGPAVYVVHGRLFAPYVAGYCVGRFWVECCATTRPPRSPVSGSTRSHRLVFIGAVVYLWPRKRAAKNPKGAGQLLEEEGRKPSRRRAATVAGIRGAAVESLPRRGPGASAQTAEVDENPARAGSRGTGGGPAKAVGEGQPNDAETEGPSPKRKPTSPRSRPKHEAETEGGAEEPEGQEAGS